MRARTNTKWVSELQGTWIQALREADGVTTCPLCIKAVFKDVIKIVATESAQKLTSSRRDPEIEIKWKR